jgi:Family of unknown function (DUF5330)
MRIIRTIVLLAVAAYFLPSPPEDRLGTSLQANDPPATEFLSAAVSTVADMSDFCTRQAAVCDTAHYLAVKLEGKAKYGIELLYQWANESNDLAPPQQAYDNRGTVTQSQTAAANDAGADGQNTLQLEDLIPEWRAPAHQG